MKKIKEQTTIQKELSKGFSNENQFKSFLINNIDYVLELMTEEKSKKGQKFIYDSTFLICSIRYAIGRKNQLSNHVVNCIIKEWDRLEESVKSDVVKEIVEFERYYGDFEMWDREEWYRIVNKRMCGLLDETF